MADPFLISVSATLAARTVIGLYELVKKKFTRDPEAMAALEAADQDKPESLQVLAERLDIAMKADTDFAAAVMEQAPARQTGDSDNVLNQNFGHVEGKLLQARDIHGDVSF
ncbi:hypothetical protein SAMN05421504_10573 [Amycolatopsis xylanica]|uniref:Uncharacterized protein n=1 Tax=Amycolatopsis xylanica TaxID=589385 RepID=A0A1H3IPS0_9PSEU|nr:hypothetical protein [Amycolatopsis xylanica]SDY29691.1 hypothetical protein SAMN05421504_10573 [Amycolatopsis xylanica]